MVYDGKISPIVMIEEKFNRKERQEKKRKGCEEKIPVSSAFFAKTFTLFAVNFF